jgi:hypothetical protein
VILAVLNRLTGKPVETRALFHDVLRLEPYLDRLAIVGAKQSQAGLWIGGLLLRHQRGLLRIAGSGGWLTSCRQGQPAPEDSRSHPSKRSVHLTILATSSCG